MSWFDTGSLANIASKAMKEAQKTLDKALDIEAEQEQNKVSDSKWAGWNKLIKSESESSLSKDPSEGSGSTWGSFSGSFFDGGTSKSDVVEPEPVINKPVSNQPRKQKPCGNDVIVAGNIDQSEKLSIPASQSQNSLMEGCSEEELLSCQNDFKDPGLSMTGSWEGDQFASSRLIVTCSPDEDPADDNVISDQPVITRDTEDAVDSRCSSEDNQSSIEAISPSSIEIISPSSVEVISEDASPTNQDPLLPIPANQEAATLLSLIPANHAASKLPANNQVDPKYEDSSLSSSNGDSGFPLTPAIVEELNTSVSSDKTIVQRDGEEEEKSCVLESMLTEAMLEAEKKSTDGSSQSSELGKLECPSETSCDEFENYTATSSDVEVISSPVNSRLSTSSSSGGGTQDIQSKPNNLISRNGEDHRTLEQYKDLQRTLDQHKADMAELRKKNNDLAEVLQAREGKLIAVSREIGQVQEESGQMSVRLEAALKEADQHREAAAKLAEANARLTVEVKEERREKGELKKRMDRVEKEINAKKGDDDEKDEIITDLRAEGESLAKQNGKLAEIIRKLRAKEKSRDGDLKKATTELEKLKADAEKTTKDLSVKIEAESALNKTLKSLADANQAWEVENTKLKSDLEDHNEKVAGLRSSLETAYRELAEMKHRLTEAKDEANATALAAEADLRREAERRFAAEESGREADKLEYEARIGNIQAALNSCERLASDREEAARREIDSIRYRLETSENRHEDISESISQASKPLLRQVESLQAALKESQANADRVEQSLTERFRQTSSSLATAQERERSVAEQYRIVSAKLAALQSNLDLAEKSRVDMCGRVEGLESELLSCKEARETELATAQDTIHKLQDEITQIRRDREFLSVSLESEKAEGESRRKKSLALMDQLKERDRRVRELQAEMDQRLLSTSSKPGSVRSSPSPSTSSLLSSFQATDFRDGWADDVFHGGSVAPTLYDSVKNGGTTAVVESLHAQLKMKEGEISQLQNQIIQSEALRDSLANELTSTAETAEMATGLELEVEDLKKKLSDLQAKYQTMLTMYGEKVEEAEELKLDLQDVKEMYKTQIDQLLGREENAE